MQHRIGRQLADHSPHIVLQCGGARCTAVQAFAVLRTTSQNRNTKLWDVAAALIEAVSGAPPPSLVPFTQR